MGRINFSATTSRRLCHKIATQNVQYKILKQSSSSSSPGKRRDSYRHQYNRPHDQYCTGTELHKIRTSYLSHF